MIRWVRKHVDYWRAGRLVGFTSHQLEDATGVSVTHEDGSFSWLRETEKQRDARHADTLAVARSSHDWMYPSEVMETWRPGSQPWPWSWDDERDDLNSRGELDSLIDEWDPAVCDPVLLGHDGRVWNGHHRVLAADKAGRRLPVFKTTEGEPIPEELM